MAAALDQEKTSASPSLVLADKPPTTSTNRRLVAHAGAASPVFSKVAHKQKPPRTALEEREARKKRVAFSHFISQAFSKALADFQSAGGGPENEQKMFHQLHETLGLLPEPEKPDLFRKRRAQRRAPRYAREREP